MNGNKLLENYIIEIQKIINDSNLTSTEDYTQLTDENTNLKSINEKQNEDNRNLQKKIDIINEDLIVCDDLKNNNRKLYKNLQESQQNLKQLQFKLDELLIEKKEKEKLVEDFKNKIQDCEKKLEVYRSSESQSQEVDEFFKKLKEELEVYRSSESQSQESILEIEEYLNKIEEELNSLNKEQDSTDLLVKSITQRGGASFPILITMSKTRLGEDFVKNLYGSKENFIIRVIKYAKYSRINRLPDITDLIINFQINKFGFTELQVLFEHIYNNNDLDDEIDKMILDNDTTDDKIISNITNPECSKYIWSIMNHLKQSLQGNNKYLDKNNEEDINKYLNVLRKAELKLLEYSLTISMYNKNISIFDNYDQRTVSIDEMKRQNKLWNGNKYNDICRLKKLII